MNKTEQFAVQRFLNAADAQRAALRNYCTAFGAVARTHAQVSLDAADAEYSDARSKLAAAMDFDATQKTIRSAQRLVNAATRS